MKSCIYIMFVGLMSFLIIGCHRGEMPRPLNFTTYEGNPILSPGAPGEWDELFLWNPQTMLHEGVFYLFYTGGNVSGRMSVGLATSEDGLHFSKYSGSPVISPGEDSPGSYTVGPGILLKTDSLWWMYYNAQDVAAFAPGRFVGRATATSLYGPWIKDKAPVISSGSKGEWDAGFIIPSSILLLNDGTYMMFYSAGNDIVLFDEFDIGMATSTDGLIWTKYNDPLSTKHPFAESDPVLTSGQEGEWDGGYVWMANVTYTTEGFRMYYSASAAPARSGLKAIGYAESRDGIHWVKYKENPVYSIEQAMNVKSPENVAFMENPALIYLDTICLMFYEYGDLRLETTRIGVATAKLK